MKQLSDPARKHIGLACMLLVALAMPVAANAQAQDAPTVVAPGQKVPAPLPNIDGGWTGTYKDISRTDGSPLSSGYCIFQITQSGPFIGMVDAMGDMVLSGTLTGKKFTLTGTSHDDPTTITGSVMGSSITGSYTGSDCRGSFSLRRPGATANISGDWALSVRTTSPPSSSTSSKPCNIAQSGNSLTITTGEIITRGVISGSTFVTESTSGNFVIGGTTSRGTLSGKWSNYSSVPNQYGTFTAKRP